MKRAASILRNNPHCFLLSRHTPLRDTVSCRHAICLSDTLLSGVRGSRCRIWTLKMQTTATAPVVFDRSQLADLRLIPSIEKYPKLVLFAQTGVGKITVWGLFVLGLWYFFRTPIQWIPITVSLLLITLLPKWRWNLVAACTLRNDRDRNPISLLSRSNCGRNLAFLVCSPVAG